MNRIWLRNLVIAAWAIPIGYIGLAVFVFGGSLDECSGTVIGLWISSILFEAAAIAGLLATRVSWLGAAAAGAFVVNACLYWAGLEEFMSLMS